MQKRDEVKIPPIDLEDNKRIGLVLPFGHGDTLFKQTFTTEEQASSNFINLILTERGERYGQPNFGVKLKSRLFDNLTKELLNDIKEDIRSSVAYWLPYIILENIDSLDDPGNHGVTALEHTITLNITFRVTERGANQSIVIFINANGALNTL